MHCTRAILWKIYRINVFYSWLFRRSMFRWGWLHVRRWTQWLCCLGIPIGLLVSIAANRTKSTQLSFALFFPTSVPVWLSKRTAGQGGARRKGWALTRTAFSHALQNTNRGSTQFADAIIPNAKVWYFTVARYRFHSAFFRRLIFFSVSRSMVIILQENGTAEQFRFTELHTVFTKKFEMCSRLFKGT